MKKEQFLTRFQEQLFVKFPNGYQHWWPKFIFHFSDINNIISILNSGKLYSREKAIELGLMQNDNADDDVIVNTQNLFKGYVRCYFGAKTPTQYINEGIKPKNKISNNAHCPVPVFLLFDFVKLLSRGNIKFSSGNIAATDAAVFNNINYLKQLEFEYIYHRGSLPDENIKRHIKYCRQAEVLIFNELNVYDYLKVVCVRSKADRDTLLYNLNNEAKKKLKDKIKIFTGEGLFEKRELHVVDVELENNNIIMYFANPSSSQYEVELIAEEIKTQKEYVYKHNVSISNEKMSWKIDKILETVLGFNFTIRIDGNLVYKNLLINLDNVPF